MSQTSVSLLSDRNSILRFSFLYHGWVSTLHIIQLFYMVGTSLVFFLGRFGANANLCFLCAKNSIQHLWFAQLSFERKMWNCKIYNWPILTNIYLLLSIESYPCRALEEPICALWAFIYKGFFNNFRSDHYLVTASCHYSCWGLNEVTLAGEDTNSVLALGIVGLGSG